MNKLTPYFYFSAIRSAIPYAYDIRSPKVRGSLNSVFIVPTKEETYVCKFNHKHLAEKNAAVSKLMISHGIPVPEINVHSYRGSWFEIYSMIPGQTLYEQVGAGLSVDKIRKIYDDILKYFSRMSEINPSPLYNLECKYTHQVAKTNVTDVNNEFLAQIVSGGVRLMNAGRAHNRGIYHTGITPKNVIISPAGNFAGFIDLDEVAICDIHYAFGAMASKYQQLGGNINDLIAQYEIISGKRLNCDRIAIMAYINSFGKHMLWANARKQAVK